MDFPNEIDSVLRAWGIASDTRAALYELFSHLGEPALEVFADIAETAETTSGMRPADLEPIKQTVARRYVDRYHDRWMLGVPSPSFWHHRDLGGRAAGLVTPIGTTRESEGLPFRVAEMSERALGEGQAVPRGLLVLSRNGHFGGRLDTVTFDLVASEIEDAHALARSEGRQHSIPGSIGETSGSYSERAGVGLVWEIQPNVLKPSGDRNRDIKAIWRRMRNWHVLTLMTAVLWLQERSARTYIVEGGALAATHEANPREPLSMTIAEMHDRTIGAVVRAIGGELQDATKEETSELIELGLANTGLSRHLEAGGRGVSRIVFGN